MVLAASILSILLNPLLFAAAEGWGAQRKPAPGAPPLRPPRRSAGPERPAPPMTALAGHDVLVGYGRVGALVGAGLKASGRPLLVFEDDAAAARPRAAVGSPKWWRATPPIRRCCGRRTCPPRGGWWSPSRRRSRRGR